MARECSPLGMSKCRQWAVSASECTTALSPLRLTKPNGLEPQTSTVSILKMGIAVMSSSSVPGSIHAGFMALAHLFR